MRSFKQFMETWLEDPHFGNKQGDRVIITKTGDVNNGKTGEILRQQGTEFGIEVLGKGLEWYRADQFSNPKKAKEGQKRW